MSGDGRRTLLVGAVVVVAVAVGFASLPSAPSELEQRAPAVEAPDARVRVEVLNVGGVTGMAGEATVSLRDLGFDVVDFGNSLPFDSMRISEVVDRVGRPDVARSVAEALGIDNVHSAPDPNLFVDVSVLLGSEWARPGTRTDDPGMEATHPWWNPRGWLNR